MKICVLSGSPKGENSITYQTVLYLEKHFPKCSFTTLHVGQRIRTYEKDMDSCKAELNDADMILFCYPVYTFIAPSQLHRFIELMKQSGIDFSGKFAAQISTSKHFYDTTAHEYIKENCLDMNMKYLGGLSADMEDLLSKKGRREAYTFWKLALWKAKNNIFEASAKQAADSSPVRQYERSYTDAPNIVTSVSDAKATDLKDTVIVADLDKDDVSLKNMINDFRTVYPYKTKLVNIADYPFAGGCLGCFNCAATGKCIYKDGFDEFLRNEIQTGCATVYAFTIKDHSMGTRMKMFDDRQFCNGHRTVTMGMPVGYIINGDLKNEPNLKMIIEGRAQVGGNFLVGMATDKKGILNLSKTLVYAIRHKTKLPGMFLGVGGMKIFRDLIWEMQGMMKADHKFYKEHGFYDFPQKHVGTILKMKLVGMLISNKKVQEKIGGRMTEEMLKPYKKVM